MEDLVLNSLLPKPGPMNISKRVENSVSHATPTESSRVFAQPDENEKPYDEAIDMPKEIPLERPRSPLSSLGHIGLVRSQRNALQAELRQQQDASAEAKRSISSLRKLALRLAVRISVKEANIASHSKALSKARMNQYLLEQQHLVQGPSHVRSGNFPLSPPQSPGPNKPLPLLPSMPRWDSTGHTSTVRFSPLHDTVSIREVIDNGEDRLIKMDASRASLKEELDVTQRKLARLFESQALLREKYNSEREKSRTLDAECQETHAKISSLEQSKEQIEDEARHLHERIEELERANVHLKTELHDAKVARHIIQEDLGKVQSSKLTLEHQLQAAASSKDSLETELRSLTTSSEDVRRELEKKFASLQNDAIESGATMAALEAEKEKLEDELRVTKFRLNAANDLEKQLRTQLSSLHEHESSLESDLEISRLRVAKLEEDLSSAYERLAAMDDSVTSLATKLEASEKSKIELEEATRLAKSSKDRVEAHLSEMKMNKAKVDNQLRNTRERLVATESVKAEVESEMKVLRGDLAEVQKRNQELENLVEKSESTLSDATKRTNTPVHHLQAIASDNNTMDTKARNPGQGSSSTVIEQQLVAHQREIETLHRTNDNLMAKLDAMTRELLELKNGGFTPVGDDILYSRSVSRLTDNRSASRLTDTRPGSPPEVLAAEELYDLEVKQLRETRATFDRVVKSLRNKSAQLDVLETWHDSATEDHAATPKPIGSPVISMHNAMEVDPVVEGIGRAVTAMQPTFVHGHDAESEMGILEMPPVRALRKSASEGGLTSWKDERVSRWADSVSATPRGHRRSRSDFLSYGHDDLPSNGEAILRVGFIASPSVSPVSQKEGRFWKELPSRPLASPDLMSPRSLIDKELPRIPRRPVGGSRSLDEDIVPMRQLRRAKTVEELKTKDHVWSLFPKPSQSTEMDRPATSNGYTPFNSGPRKWSFEVPQEADGKNAPQSPGLRHVVTIQDLRTKTLREESESAQVQGQEAPQRYIRLKKSISLLTSRSKKSEKGHERNLSDGGRIRSLFHRPSKVVRNAEREAYRDSPTPTPKPGHQSWTPFMQIPESPVSNPPLSPVGIYDPISKMWLTPQKSPTRTAFGVFDPESRQWMAPSPRTDSLRRVVALNQDGVTISTQRDSGATERTEEEEEEQGALSLAEKLEIIRYHPLSRSFSTPGTSIAPSHSFNALSKTDTGSTFQVQDRPRPWKPGQLLGLKAPPKDNGLDGTPLDDDDLATLRFTPPFARRDESMDAGSGYMSFESEHEARRRDWKGLLKNVYVPQMLRRSSNLRHER